MKSQLPETSFHQLDMRNREATELVLQLVKPTQIYHLASIATAAGSFENSREVLFNNIELQLNLLESIKQNCPTARVLIVGSADGYGVSVSDSEVPIAENHPLRPINPYGVSKITQEMLAFAYGQSWKLNLLLVRPFNHIGERQTGDFAVASFARQIIAVERGEQPSIKVGSLEGVRDFTDVKDMVRAYEIVMEKGAVLKPYNIGSGVGVSMQKLLDELKSLATKDVPIEVDQQRIRPLDIPVIIANNEKVKALGWNTEIPLHETLQRVLAYWRTQ
jgi:GDP-4-dehydro-6-deoxy-D-mannose reductase